MNIINMDDIFLSCVWNELSILLSAILFTFFRSYMLLFNDLKKSVMNLWKSLLKIVVFVLFLFDQLMRKKSGLSPWCPRDTPDSFLGRGNTGHNWPDDRRVKK